jgi:hypothetical protein
MSSPELVIDAEIVAPLDLAAAKRLDSRIRRMAEATAGNLVTLADLIAEAKQGQIHLALGFRSWTAYLADALGKLQMVLTAESRRELVGRLADEGMSERAISTAVGVSQPTVHRDVVASRPAQVIHDESPDGVDQGSIATSKPSQATVVTGVDGKNYRKPSRPPSGQPKPRRGSAKGQVSHPPDVLAEVVKSITAVAVGCHFIDPKSVDQQVLIQHAATIRDCLDCIHDIIDGWGGDPR